MTINTDYPKPTFYTVGYHCKNCGYNWDKEFARGKRAVEKVTCPRCDCYDAEKKNVRPSPPYDPPSPFWPIGPFWPERLDRPYRPLPPLFHKTTDRTGDAKLRA